MNRREEQRAAQAQSLLQLGLRHAQRGDYSSALACFDQALAAEPMHVEAQANRAAALGMLGREEEALRACEQLLRRVPAHVEAQRNRALLLVRLGLIHQAIAAYESLIGRDPADTLSRLHCASALMRIGRHGEARAQCEGVLGADANHLEAQYLLALALAGEDRLLLALAHFEALQQRQPGNAGFHYERAVVLEKLGRRDEARRCYDVVLAAEPRHADARFNRSLLLLSSGDYEAGWRDYEQRWLSTPFRGCELESSMPRWRGDLSLQGRTLLLHNEQGIGDALQMLRYLPLLAGRGARLALALPESLHALAARLPSVAQVALPEYPLPPHDLHCALMSLPAAFGSRTDTLPVAVPYLVADPERARAWAQRLAASPRARIGLVWAGRQYPPMIPRRDVALHRLRGLFELDADFISLQKEIPQADRSTLDLLPKIARLGEALADFDDTAALIENLDLVIAVDTAVVHLAGALGKPVWLLNRYASCWRWGEAGETSAWYPGLRIFRQPVFEDWDSVAATVADELRAWLAVRRCGLS